MASLQQRSSGFGVATVQSRGLGVPVASSRGFGAAPIVRMDPQAQLIANGTQQQKDAAAILATGVPQAVLGRQIAGGALFQPTPDYPPPASMGAASALPKWLVPVAIVGAVGLLFVALRA